MEEIHAKETEELGIITENIEINKDALVSSFKKYKTWIFYVILVVITSIGLYIRTRNISKLTDITTGTWTLGPDLDPFLFLRWAKEIVANGSLAAVDIARYVPLGYNTAGEMKLLAYMIAWFHKILTVFSFSDSITYSAIIFPVFMFGLTALAFFLFARKVFYKEDNITKNSIALLATAFFVLVPSLLPRTIAGIPEKESAAFFFMFLAFYFFIDAFASKDLKKGLMYGALAGISTGLMALVWGGFSFVFFTIASAMLISFLLGKIKLKEFYVYTSWLIVSFVVMMPFSTRYSIENLLASSSTGFGILVFSLIGMSLILMGYDKKELLKQFRTKTKLPMRVFYLLISLIVIVIFVSIFLGINFIPMHVSDTVSSLIKPIESRFGLTVAENKQPFFVQEWRGNFGPTIPKTTIPLYFWMFFVGSVLLFYELIKVLRKKERATLTLSYVVFLVCLIFSKYSPNTKFNGTNGTSIFIYFLGWIFIVATMIYVYRKKYLAGELSVFKDLNFAYILYFIILTLAIIAARSATRLVMVLGAVSPVAIAFLVVVTVKKAFTEKEEMKKLVAIVLAVVLVIASVYVLYSNYNSNKYQAENFAPGIYQWQWQSAMAWVRDNTPTNAVFAHWWDYGYWLQSIGERATILDGGNAIVYWNHLMGRYVLTGADEKKALEFLYTHKGTHLLIDSTEIGKYTAYSSIGADENYDRYSWIPSLFLDERQIVETNNETVLVYPGSTPVDGDIVWTFDGREVLFPRNQAFVAGVILRINSNGNVFQPEALYIKSGEQSPYRIPLKYLYINNELIEFDSGLDAGVFVFPRVENAPNGGLTRKDYGAMFYLSPRTVHSQVARLYLFGQESEYFKLVHEEESYLTKSLREQGLDVGKFAQYQGFHGPIKVWEINYPKDVESNPEFLETDYPNLELKLAKSGEY